MPKQAENKVYYVSSTDVQAQYIKMFKDNDLDAIILEHNIDTHFVSFLEYKENGTKFVRIDSEIGDALKSDKSDGDESSETADSELVNLFKEALGIEKLEIKAEALKTVDTPAIITINEYERRMNDINRIYGNMFGDASRAKETLIINTDNAVVKKITSIDEEKRKLLCRHIYDLAVISQRKLTAEELDGFVSRSVKVMEMI